jgi:hypothetical protein
MVKKGTFITSVNLVSVSSSPYTIVHGLDSHKFTLSSSVNIFNWVTILGTGIVSLLLSGGSLEAVLDGYAVVSTVNSNYNFKIKIPIVVELSFGKVSEWGGGPEEDSCVLDYEWKKRALDAQSGILVDTANDTVYNLANEEEFNRLINEKKNY